MKIPEGAEIYTRYNGGNEFYKSKNGIVYRFDKCCWIETNWDSISEILKECERNNFNVFWQRHSQPEELPFVDGECYTNKSNGGFKLPKDKPCDISKWSELRGESLNDQYAEIEQVRQASIADTLNERQSQYGRFKDVADTTAVFMDQFALGRMSSVQREALHMICSKLARIAHGDPNYKDNWHDIAGYATLVERSL